MANMEMSKINIPFIKQKTDYFCGPASLQMIFNYHRMNIDQEKLAEIMKTKEKVGTKKRRMIEAVKKHGFHFCAKNNSKITDIEELLENKIPVIVNFIEPSDEESHYAVIIGMNNDEVVFSDPWNGNDFRIDKKEFLKRWYGFEDNKKRWMLATHRMPFGKCLCNK